MYKWQKLGQLFNVNKKNTSLISHAANPLPVHLYNDVYRIFYSGRNSENKSSVGFVDIDIINLTVMSNPSETLALHGDLDSYYSHGISLGNLYHELSGSQSILFMGWQYPDGQHWRGEIGKISLLNNREMSVNPEPYLRLDSEDEISLSYPFVLHHDGIFKMWYGSTIDWTSSNGEMVHVIKYATSIDGEKWEKHGLAIPYEIGVAQAFSKPSVIIDQLGFHMWYSYRDGSGTPYRIGYSFSENGVVWNRMDSKSGIDVSEAGWDDEMICYPFVFKHKNKLYMLYNGNNYGELGFGLAVAE